MFAGLLGAGAALVTVPFMLTMTRKLLITQSLNVVEIVLFCMWNAWILGIPIVRLGILYLDSVKQSHLDRTYLWREYWLTQFAVLAPILTLFGIGLVAVIIASILAMLKP